MQATSETRRIPWRSSIQWQLILFSLLVGLLPVAILGTITFLQARDALRQQVSDSASGVAEAVGRDLDRYLFERYGDLQVMARAETIRNVEDTLEDKTAYLQTIKDTYGAYESIMLLTGNGRVVGSTRPITGDFSDEEWFQQAVALNDTYTTSVYYSTLDQQYVITIARPVYDLEDEFIGVIAANIDVDALINIVASVKVGERGEITFVDREGRTILDVEVAHLFEDVSDSVAVQNGLQGLSGSVIEVGHLSEEVISSYIPLAGLQGWIAITQLPLADLDVAVNALATRVIALGLVTLVIITFLVVLLSQRLIEPIRQLTASARQLSAGQFDAPILLQSNNEFGQLADTFRSMAGELQGMVASLEARVNARTQDLTTTIEIGRLANNIYAEADLMPRLVEFIRSRFNLYYTQIYLLDEAERFALLRAGTGDAGQLLLARKHRLDLSQTSLVAQAVRTGQPVVVSDTAENPNHLPNPLLPETRSEIAVPLRVGPLTLGVLDLQANQPGTFTADNASVFEALAGQIAAVIRAAQAYSEAQAQTQRAQQVTESLTTESWQNYLHQEQLGYVYDLESPRPFDDTITPILPANARRITQPIRVRGAQIGELVVAENDDRRALGEEERTLIEDAARLVAQAVERYRSLDEVKRSEQETRRLQQFLDSVIESLPIMVFVKDAQDLRFISFNKAGEELLGFTRDAFLGKNDYDFFPPAEADWFTNKDREVLDGKVLVDIPEEEIRTASGEIRTLHTRKIPIFDAQGNPQYLVGISEDITELKKSAAALVESERRFRRIIEEASDVVYTINAEGFFTFVSPSIIRLAEREPEELMGQHFTILLPKGEGWGKRLIEFYLKQLTDREIETRLEFPILSKSGQRKWVDQQATITFEDGKPVGFQAVVRDVTERVEQREALDYARRRAEILTEINSALSQAQDEQSILAGIAFFAERYNPSYMTLLYLENDARGTPETAITVSSRRNNEPALDEPLLGVPIQLTNYLTAKLLFQAGDKPLLIEDVLNDIRLHQPERAFLQQVGAQATIGLPLQSAGVWQGILSINWAEPHVISDIEREVYTALIQPLAAVVAQRRSYLAEEELRQRAEILARANAMLSRAVDNAEILEAVANLAQADSAERSSLFYTEADDYGRIHLLNLVASRTRDGRLIALSNLPRTEFLRDEYPLIDEIESHPDTPLFIENVDLDPRCDDNARIYLKTAGIAAFITLPLRSANRWQGLITLVWSMPRTFGPDLRERYSDIMPTTSSVLASRRAFADSVEAQLESETLYLLSSAINETQREADIVDAIQRFIAPANTAAITLGRFNRDNHGQIQSFEVLADWQQIEGFSTVGLQIPADSEQFAQIATGGEFVIIGNTQTDPTVTPAARELYQSINIIGIIAAPMKVAGREWGALSMTTDKPVTFSQRDQRVFHAAVEQANQALERLYLTQQTERRAGELATIARLSSTTTQILDVDELLQTVTDLTKTSFDYYHAHIYLLNATGDRLVLAAGAGEPGRLMKERGHAIPISRPDSLVATAARERRGAVSNDVTQSPNFLPNPLLPDTRSELALPMIVGNKLVGVLDVQSTQVNRFSDEDVLLKTALADQIAVAVDNALAFREQQQVAERLREVDRLKSQFLANMSHELRTPLNSIIGYAEVLLDGIDGDLNDEAMEDVDAIHSSGKHLLTIINDILDLAKIEAGQMYIDRREVQLLPLVEDVMNTLSILARNKGIELSSEGVDDAPSVLGDPIRLKQIILNLINNAIKFTEQGGVTLAVSRDPNNPQQVLLCVRDTGIGMSPEEMKGLFQQFHQVDGSPTRRAGGTGLGLVISRHLVQMHHSDIEVSSEKGVGSVFTFRLPAFVKEPVPQA